MNFPINVIYVSHFEHSRMGGQQSMIALIKHLDRDKVKPMAICPSPGELADKLVNIDCPVFYVKLPPLKPITCVKLFRSAMSLRSILQRNKIRIIHVDSASNARTCGIVKLMTPTKMVWHVRLTNSNHNDRYIQYLADGIIGISDATKGRFSDSLLISAKFKTIFNGVDCKLFHPVEDKSVVRKKLKLPYDKFILSFVGQIKQGKGIFDMVSAMSILKRDSLKEQMPMLLFIGTPLEDEDLGKIKNAISKNRLDEDINIISQQSNIYEWMQASDALILPSHEGIEGMGRVIFEAMACGTAAIGTDISGLREAITPESGILIKEKSPSAIAGVIKRLIENPRLLKNLQENGRKRAVEVFDISIHARSVEKFYIDMMNRKFN